MAGLSSLVGLRQPPANLEAEQALLGALLANNKAYERVAEFLRPDHFADATHGMIFGAVQRRIEAGGVADPVSLRAEFESNGLLDGVGGAAYLAKLIGAMVGIINAGEYGRVIEDAWLRRQLVDIGEAMVNRAHGAEPELRGRDQLELADTALLSIAESRAAEGLRDGHQVARALVDDMMGAIARRGALPGVTYGFRGLDRMTGGMRPAQFILLGARPSMGKTALALNVALAAARGGQRVYFVSAEMRAEGVMARAVAQAAGVPLSVLTRGGRMDINTDRWRPLAGADPEVDSVAVCAREIGDLPIIWDDGASTIAAIRARARRLQRQPGGLGVVIVDYLSRIRPSAEAARNGAVAMATELSRGFKDLAMQLGVPVLLLSQLNRQVEGRDDKQPVMSDLRDSGALEQDADVVMFLHRAHYYLSRSEPKRTAKERAADFEARVAAWEKDMASERGRATISVAKQRQGPIGPVRVLFDDDTAQFRDEPEAAR
jgi:replicative DNA helicase